MGRYFVLLLAIASLVLTSCDLITEPEDEYEFTVFDAWWSDEVDQDGDDYYQSARLNFDIDVDTGTHMIRVKIYYRETGTSTYTLYYTTTPFEITEYESDDAYWVAMGDPNPELDRGAYDFLVRVYPAEGDEVLAECDRSNDSDLAEVYCEPADEDGAGYSLYNAWWTDVIDMDSDTYARSGNLNFDIDISLGSDVVYVKLYYKLTSASAYSFYAESDTFTIEGYSAGEGAYISIGATNPELTQGLYDFKMEVLRYETDAVVVTATSEDDGSLGYNGFETTVEDGGNANTFSIYSVWWANQVDNDDDGYYYSAQLSFDVDVNSGTHAIYARISYKSYLNSTYLTYYTTETFEITDYNASDAYWVYMGTPNTELSHGIYDFKIDIYDADTDEWLVMKGPEQDSDLDNVYVETAAEDGSSSETYSVYNAWWTDAVDNDGDEYPWYRKLNMDIDCSSGTHNIYVKVLYKYASGSTWTDYFETGVFAITEYSSGDAIWVAIGSPNAELGHTLYDFRIDVYKEGGSSPVASMDPSGDSDLNDMAAETAVEDGANDRTFDVYDAWWADEVDGDSDSYTSYRKLYFDVDVSSGSWPVYVRVLYKTASASTYSTYFTTTRYMITGYNSSDAHWVAVGLPNTQLPHNSYDFRVEAWVPGTSAAKASSDAADDSSLDNQSFEMASED